MSLKTRCAVWLAGALLAGSALAHDHASHAAADGKPAAKVDYAKVWLEKQQTAPRLAVAADFDATGTLWLARVVGQQIFVSHAT
ncbi:MAG TPA: exo-alpha-sialidase, partial [Azonexus sp.]|nr:exo-alpha-sialidase [Azonexus sp.]